MEITIDMEIKNEEQAMAYFRNTVAHLDLSGFMVMPTLTEKDGAYYPSVSIKEMTRTQHDQHLARLAEEKEAEAKAKAEKAESEKLIKAIVEAKKKEAEKKEAKAKAETGVEAEKVNAEVEVKEVKAK